MNKVPADYIVLPDQSIARQLADRCRSLERQLKEAREALVAAEARENDLIDRLRGEGGL
jgi:hypothetical protein